MSRIERIELWHVSVPLEKPFWPSWIPGYPQTHVRYTLARLFADDGRVGISAGNAFSTERKGLGDLLGGYLLGVQADDIPAARQRIREASYLGWRNWWLEVAFWDLKAQGEGRPVYRLLQSKDETVLKAPVYASSGEVRPMSGRGPWLDDIRARGIRAIKIRVKDPARRDDVSVLREVRREVGDGFVVAVDANQGWPVSLIEPTPVWDLEYATAFGRACDDLGIAWIEEPLDMHDWDGMAELRRRVRTPLAGAELLGDWHEVRAVMERDCLARYQPDCTFCGGYEVARRVMAECAGSTTVPTPGRTASAWRSTSTPSPPGSAGTGSSSPTSRRDGFPRGGTGSSIPSRSIPTGPWTCRRGRASGSASTSGPWGASGSVSPW
jgi:L-alanine-DL-glutamate epimerase-like enolase superfamily enzyme